MEFQANNPDMPNKPVAVMMVYNNTPASVMALKKSGIAKTADLTGKKLGAPVFDAGRSAFPLFAKEIGRAPSELQSQSNLVCRLLLEKKKKHQLDGQDS